MSDASRRLERAQRYYEKGKIDDALEEYLLALKEDPSNDGVLEIIAELYLRQNQIQKAMECYGYLFDKRAEKNDGPAAVLMFRKMTRLGMQDPERMLACARFQEKQRPEEARDFYRHSAQLFLERGEKARALDALRGLAALEDSNPEAHVRLGELAESLGQKEIAAQAFARAGELLGAGDSSNGSRRGAVALLERAHTLVPDDTRIRVVLATALSASGNPARAAELLEPLAGDVPERNRLLTEACLAIGKFARAEEVLWETARRMPEAHYSLLRVMEGYLGAGKADSALSLLRRLKQAMFAASKEQEFLGWVEGLQKKHPASIEVVDFLASLYQDMNQESKAGATLAGLFDVCLDAGDYARASSALERLADAKANDPENKPRLERLKGKLDEPSYQALASRVLRKEAPGAGFAQEQAGGQATAGGTLEEMILQAELLMQFGSKDQAIGYLQDIARLYPGAESSDERLRSLFVEGGLAPRPAPAAAAARKTAAASPAVAQAEEKESVADLTRVSEITRNVHRQATVKGVLSTIVSEIGKTWQVSRCVAGLCAPGKPPTAALEFCAQDIKPSDGMSLGKLVASLAQLTANGNPLAAEDAASSTRLSQIRPVIQALGIRSLLALPLMDGDQPTGVVVLQQCERLRRWRSNEILALKTIVDQMVISISHMKLRSLMKAVADESSGLLNRSSYVDCLLAESVRAQKQNTPLSVVLLQFACGPQTIRELGENNIQQFMQQAAQVLLGNLRQNDVGVRYDSTTLAIVLPSTRGKETFSVVDKVRKVLSGIKIGDHEPPLSAGIAEAVLQGKIDPADSITELINRVEAALEAAQKEGCGNKLLLPPTGVAA